MSNVFLFNKECENEKCKAKFATNRKNRRFCKKACNPKLKNSNPLNHNKKPRILKDPFVRNCKSCNDVFETKRCNKYTCYSAECTSGRTTEFKINCSCTNCESSFTIRGRTLTKNVSGKEIKYRKYFDQFPENWYVDHFSEEDKLVICTDCYKKMTEASLKDLPETPRFEFVRGEAEYSLVLGG